MFRDIFQMKTVTGQPYLIEYVVTHKQLFSGFVRCTLQVHSMRRDFKVVEQIVINFEIMWNVK